jgi:D-beta-D-heptose 7-phosphate kinase/D-beta-D-heptose 1-phosphate adenosyltransferase
MCLIGAKNPPLKIPAASREVYDVSGAGDTVIATLTAGVASGLSFTKAAQLANFAAGIVVSKLGTQPITREELRAALLLNGGASQYVSYRKIITLTAAISLIQAWRTNGERIVFTNGCFDLIHPGHIHLLNQAKASGDRLVVGLNSDRSIRSLKGPGRPMLSEIDRAAIMAALDAVDLVITFDEENPSALIQALRPDILVKGTDYTPEQVEGSDIVRSYGGRVHLVPILEGYSSTGIAYRMASSKASGG